MEDSSSDTPLPGTFYGMSLFPLTETVIDGTSEVWPTFGRPVTVFAILRKDKQEPFVEIYRVRRTTTEADKVELLKRCYLHLTQIMKVGPKLQMWTVDESNDIDGHSKTMSFGLQFSMQRANDNFHTAILEHKSNAAKLEQVNSSDISLGTENKFEKKIELSSAKMYFRYYGQLLHQQNMMQDKFTHKK